MPSLNEVRLRLRAPDAVTRDDVRTLVEHVDSLEATVEELEGQLLCGACFGAGETDAGTCGECGGSGDEILRWRSKAERAERERLELQRSNASLRAQWHARNGAEAMAAGADRAELRRLAAENDDLRAQLATYEHIMRWPPPAPPPGALESCASRALAAFGRVFRRVVLWP